MVDYPTLKDIPWDLLVKEGLRLVDTARQAKAERSEEQARAATSAEAQGSIEALRRRLDAAEAQNRGSGTRRRTPGGRRGPFPDHQRP